MLAREMSGTVTPRKKRLIAAARKGGVREESATEAYGTCRDKTNGVRIIKSYAYRALALIPPAVSAAVVGRKNWLACLPMGQTSSVDCPFSSFP